MKNKKKIIIILVAIFLVLGIGVTVFILILNKNTDTSTDTTENLEIATIDAESYFKENGEIISTIDANDSKVVMTEKEAFNSITDRGLGELTITTDYLMNGNHLDDPLEIDGNSSEKHPAYMGQYISTSGEYWSILIYNGTIMAYPLSYNLQEDIEVAAVISESDTIMSYDNMSNTFYETIPNNATLKVIKVDKIDAQTLNKLTVKEIGKK